MLNTMPAVHFSAPAAAATLTAPLPPPALATTQPPQAEPHADVTDAVRRQVSTRFVKKPRKQEDSCEESSSEKEQDEQLQTTPRRKRAKKQGKSDIWPNMHVYSVAGQKVDYEELSWQQFLAGYLAVARLAPPADQAHIYAHLEVLAEDLQSFPFQAVRAFHGVWLQEIQSGKVQWADTTTRDVLRRRYVWIPASAAARAPSQQASRSSPPKVRGRPNRGKANGTIFRQNKPCPAYQNGNCKQDRDHANVDHVCKYCLLKMSRRSRHPMKDCRSMPADANQDF
jgi:hypothetical protein